MTKTQQARKLAKAQRKMAEANIELNELCDYYSANAYKLTREEWSSWQDALTLLRRSHA